MIALYVSARVAVIFFAPAYKVMFLHRFVCLVSFTVNRITQIVKDEFL